MIDIKDIHKLADSYNTDEITIGVLGGHSTPLLSVKRVANKPTQNLTKPEEMAVGASTIPCC